MEPGNRLLMWLLFGIILGSVAAAFVLEYQAKQGAIAFIGLASTALGVLSPSPFQAAKHADASQQVDAPNAQQVTLNQPQPPIAQTADDGAKDEGVK